MAQESIIIPLEDVSLAVLCSDCQTETIIGKKLLGRCPGCTKTYHAGQENPIELYFAAVESMLAAHNYGLTFRFRVKK